MMSMVSVPRQFPSGDAVAFRLAVDQHPRAPGLLVDQRGQEALRGPGVPPGLHQDVEDVAVLVNHLPQALPLAVDLDEDLVGMPLFPGRSPSA
jgi:hypothetical protein